MQRNGLRVGRPDVEVDASSHTPGVRSGNEVGSYRKQGGHLRDGRSTARRSTGIRPGKRNTNVPGAPMISPP